MDVVRRPSQAPTTGPTDHPAAAPVTADMPPGSTVIALTPAQTAVANARLFASAATAEAIRLELLRAITALEPGGAISWEPTPTGGFEVRRLHTRLFVGLEELSDLLPTHPTPKRIERICIEIGCRVGLLGKTPVVAVEEFNRKLLEDAERRAP